MSEYTIEYVYANADGDLISGTKECETEKEACEAIENLKRKRKLDLLTVHKHTRIIYCGQTY